MSVRSPWITKTAIHHVDEPFKLESGRVLPELHISYEIYGRMNKNRTNIILVCHALTGDAHLAGYYDGARKPGWWDVIVGPNKTLDTQQYCIICSNVLGGCAGTTGPASINPESGREYAATFPVITIGDMVRAQHLLLRHLQVSQLCAVIGGSMGGMQALDWAVRYPDMVSKLILLATTARSTPQQIAFHAIGRRAIQGDSRWNKGEYYGKERPDRGLSVARMIGHITYLSDHAMEEKFGREVKNKEQEPYALNADFQVESYLDYQGNQFCERFDPNSYLYITKAVDLFDLTKNGCLVEGLAPITARTLAVGISSDWLYPPQQVREIVKALRMSGTDAEYAEITSRYGHDAFLLEMGQLDYLISGFLSPKLVSDIMLQPVSSIKEDDTIEKACQVMVENTASHLPVLNKSGKISGIVTSWDIAKAVAYNFKTLDEIITRNVRTISPDDTIQEAALRMKKHDISALVVSRDEKLLGIVTSEGVSGSMRVNC
ncbi:MAG: homoserine O-acetyltransferase [Methanomicrobiales archaeon]|jgi:homoserine O-acetyltransferase|nr:homoserine O-acetyltransferase [Methanomicrobiales archaeon]